MYTVQLYVVYDGKPALVNIVAKKCAIFSVSSMVTPLIGHRQENKAESTHHTIASGRKKTPISINLASLAPAGNRAASLPREQRTPLSSLVWPWAHR